MSSDPVEEGRVHPEKGDIEEGKEVEDVEVVEPWGRRILSFIIRSACASAVGIVVFKSMQQIRSKYLPRLPYQEQVSKRGPFSIRSFWPYLTQIAAASSALLADTVIFGTKARPNGLRKMGKKNSFKAIQRRLEKQRINGGPIVNSGNPNKKSKTELIQGDFQFLERQRELDTACSQVFANAKKVCPVQQMFDGSERITRDDFLNYIDTQGMPFDCKMFFTNLLEKSLTINEDQLQTLVHKVREKPLVFLGGVCGSTSWRQDLVIPAFALQGITYYNPQVEDWKFDLIAIEALFKALCPVLLFVVDENTRAVASLVELSNLATQGRRLIVVLADTQTNSSVDKGPVLGELEAQDLNRGRAYLRDILKIRKIPYFVDLPDALEAAIHTCQEYLLNKSIV